MRYMVVTIANNVKGISDLMPGRYVKRFDNDDTRDSEALHEFLCAWYLTEYTVKFTDTKPRGAKEL